VGGDIAGGVERFTLRATYLRSVDGELHVVPNGGIRIVSNITRNWSRAMVDLGVAYEEKLHRVLAVLEQEAEAYAQEREVAGQLIENPTVIGPLSLGDWAVTVRVTVKTLPERHRDVGRALRRRLPAARAREQITLPYPRQEVMVRGSSAQGTQLPGALGCWRSVHLCDARADPPAIEAKAHPGMIGQQRHRNGAVRDPLGDHQRCQAHAKRVVVRAGVPDRDLLCLPGLERPNGHRLTWHVLDHATS